VAGQGRASFKKDFVSVFHVPLPDYPIACKIDNVSLLCELLFGKTILAFGKYDLIFCFQNRGSPSSPAYDTVIVTRTFCDQIQLTWPLTALRGLIGVQACFGQPLHVRIRAGKPARLNLWENLWDLLKNLITGRTWIEAHVEGRITADITFAHESPELELEIEEPLPQARVDTTSGQQEAGAELAVLAALVQKIIDRRQGKETAREETERQETGWPEQPATLPENPNPSVLPAAPVQYTISPGQGAPGATDMTKVTEMVMNIMHAHEAARARQEQGRLQYPPGTERQAYPGAPHLQGQAPAPARSGRPGAPPPSPGRALQQDGPAYPFQIPLEQIASRPGLERFINNPPPKPAGAG
jgi:hypothetical protein